MHIRNLAGVIASGNLFCENQRQEHQGSWQSIAHENIQDRRRAKPVPCGPRGTVCDYVPWYYAPKSPMLYAHYRGNVPGNPNGQKPIIYFRSTIQRVVQVGLRFVFTDGHAIMFNTRFFHDLADLDEIDWALMLARFWHSINDDPDRPRRRQAEFLVHRSFPFSLVEEIVTFDKEALLEVENSLQRQAHKPIIRMNKIGISEVICL